MANYLLTFIFLLRFWHYSYRSNTIDSYRSLCWSFFLLRWYLSYRPCLGPIITVYLPSAILSGFIYVILFAMLGMAKLEGYVSRSKKEIKACNMVFYFLLGNVFFLTLLSGSLLDQIGKSVTHPRDFPSHLASAVSAQVSVLILIDSLDILCNCIFLFYFFSSCFV